MAHLPTGLLLFTSSLESVGGKESSRRAHLISHFSVWKQQFYGFLMQLGFPGGLVVKNPPASAGDTGLITGSGRSPGGENGNTSQYSCPGNPIDRGPWQATIYGVSRESDTTEQLNNNNATKTNR